MDKPSLRVAVQIDRRRQPNRWEDWGYTICGVIADLGQFGAEPRLLRDDGVVATTLYPGFEVALHPSEAEGYYLNLSSGAPVWFVMWRVSDEDASQAWPVVVTLSYHEAGRMLDAQERVDNVPLPADVRGWLQDYTDRHYRPEPRKRARPASFKPTSER